MLLHLPHTNMEFLLFARNHVEVSSIHPSARSDVFIPILKPSKDLSLPNAYRHFFLASCFEDRIREDKHLFVNYRQHIRVVF
jgi:hypothetical protein